MFTPDAVDARILQALVAEPRITVSELAERAGVVRNTAQARLERHPAEGVERRAHQLREEAADDAVLASDIVDTRCASYGWITSGP